MVPQNTHSLMKRRAASLQPPKIIYFCTFRPKRAWNYAYLAHRIQNFPRQGGTAPLQPTKSYKHINSGSKGTVIVHLWFTKIHILLWKEVLPLYNHQKPYFCKFRPKRAWNYACLARRIQNFLRKGCAAPSWWVWSARFTRTCLHPPHVEIFLSLCNII